MDPERKYQTQGAQAYRQADHLVWVNYFAWWRGMNYQEREIGSTTGNWPAETHKLFPLIYETTTPMERDTVRFGHTSRPLTELIMRTPEEITRARQADKELYMALAGNTRLDRV